MGYRTAPLSQTSGVDTVSQSSRADLSQSTLYVRGSAASLRRKRLDLAFEGEKFRGSQWPAEDARPSPQASPVPRPSPRTKEPSMIIPSLLPKSEEPLLGPLPESPSLPEADSAAPRPASSLPREAASRPAEASTLPSPGIRSTPRLAEATPRVRGDTTPRAAAKTTLPDLCGGRSGELPPEMRQNLYSAMYDSDSD